MEDDFALAIGLDKEVFHRVLKEALDKLEGSEDSFEWAIRITKGMSEDEKKAFIKGTLYGGIMMEITNAAFDQIMMERR